MTVDRTVKTMSGQRQSNPGIKVAVLGAGGWGSNLIRTLHELGALAAVAEPNPERRTAVARDYPGVELFASASDVWESPWPAVVIATPVPTHFALAREALLAGKDVFVEKPITLRAAEAEELVALAQERRRILMVGHLLLYQPAIRWIKEQLTRGIIGDVVSLHQKRLNLGKARAVENALWSLGVHDVAVLLYLVGELPVDVWATGQSVVQTSVEDDVHVTMVFSNNVHAHLHCSWLWPEKRRQLVIVGTEGILVYDEPEQTVTLHRKRISSKLESIDNGSEIVFTGDGRPLTIECEHFLQAVQTRTKPLSDGESGRRVVLVLEKAQEMLDQARKTRF